MKAPCALGAEPYHIIQEGNEALASKAFLNILDLVLKKWIIKFRKK